MSDDLELLLYVRDALKHQELRARRDHWRVPSGVADLLAEVGFRVSRGQAGSPDAEPLPGGDGGPEPRLVRYETAARMLEVSVSTIKRLIRAGELHPVSLGGASRIRVAEIDSYIAALTESATTPNDVTQGVAS